jgi:flagellar basal-body rod modification protein FlgD
MSLTSSLNSLMRQNDPYSITAAFDGSSLNTSKMTGDRETGIFTPKDEMGKFDFLKLLTTQLQYQDPLSPMENTEFVAQLAQFTQLESTTSMEATMKQMAQIFNDSMDLQTFNAQSTTNAASVSLIGKEVRLRQNTFEHNALDESRTFMAHLGERSRGVVRIVDGDGNTVRSISLEGKDATNSARFTWDGRDDRGNKVPSDTYNLIIEGQESDNSLFCFVEDIVTGIRYDVRGTMIRVSGVEIPIGDILEVKQGDPNAMNSQLTFSQALGLVGYEVKLGGIDKITYAPLPNGRVEFDLDAGGQEVVTLIIKDNNGKQVDQKTVTREYLDKNNGKVSWEARNYGDSETFTIEISGNSSSAFFYEAGVISGVQNKNGIPMLSVNGKLVDISKILDLRPALAAKADEEEQDETDETDEVA